MFKLELRYLVNDVISRLWVKGILSYWADTLFEIKAPVTLTFDFKINRDHLLTMTNLNTKYEDYTVPINRMMTSTLWKSENLFIEVVSFNETVIRVELWL
jgi:hypothetical protein